MAEAGRATRFGLGGLVGLALGAGLVGGAWLITGDDEKAAPSGTSGAAAPGGDLSAPDKLGGFVHQDEAALDIDDGGAAGEELAERNRSWDSESGKRLSEAYGGAPAVVQTFLRPRCHRGSHARAERGGPAGGRGVGGVGLAAGLGRSGLRGVRSGGVRCRVRARWGFSRSSPRPWKAGAAPRAFQARTVAFQARRGLVF